jgi:Ca-activated chloride channel family protein
VNQIVEVGAAGATAVKVPLAAGTLKIAARANKGADPVADPVVTISAAATEEHPVPAPVWIGRDPDAEVVVPAGSYTVRVEDGLASRGTNVAVAAGGRVEVPLILGTGKLELTAVSHAGGEPLGQVIFVVSEDDPEAAGGRREIARSADPRASFTLPAGTYYVSAISGRAQARERIAIGTGGVVKHALTLNVVRIELSAQLDGGAPPAGQPITFRVLGLEPTPHELARSTAPAAEFLLAPDRYRFEAQLGAQNVRAATDLDLVAGKDLKVTLKLDSGQITIKPAAGEVRWEVRDGLGATVLRSGLGGAKSARLAPGRYVLRSDKGERSFDLKPGENRTLEVTPE